MPEGHTIHRLAARHRELFVGDKVQAGSPQGRFAEGAALLSGSVLERTEAYGKHLLHHYAGDRTLHVHLGLYGRFSDGDGEPPEPVGQVRLRLTSDRHWLELRGPTACELLDPPEVAALRDRLGPDPLRADADPERAYGRIRRSPTALAALLLDQSVVAGTGLIFVTEALFRAGLSPEVPGRQLTPAGWDALWADLCDLMRIAERRGRIDTVRDEHLPETMGRPPRVDRHGGEVYVYRRAGQPCHRCGTAVAAGTLAGRNAYWCPTCQPGRPVTVPRGAASGSPRRPARPPAPPTSRRGD
ncbi:Fpg/Nei family DNA glycosylase [Plantactinospora sp. KBS50]|uniref:Fpg/Nei family DNA glycosylase n=1 Tax=Plantactinospora sp. KBS50 TaxID=2024580 RepID=UPI000BAAC1F8|nr:DNA-formamidopyrimidine glycosylase family protein [Plantactinospora sp. KBS50]ASW56545.1 DNA glycosylase [Plantactinospora sp. KBS50]